MRNHLTSDPVEQFRLSDRYDPDNPDAFGQWIDEQRNSESMLSEQRREDARHD